MKFDLQTVAMVIGVCSVTVAPVQYVAARNYKGYVGVAMRYCAVAYFMFGMGHLLVLAHPWLPRFISRVVGCTLGISGIAVYAQSVRVLKQKPGRIRYSAAVVLAMSLGFSWFFYVTPNLPARLALMAAADILLLLPLCRDLLFDVRPEQRLTWWMTGALFTWVVFALCMRFVQLAQNYQSIYLTGDGLKLQSFYYASTFFAVIVGGFFFMLMASDEFSQQLSRLAMRDSLTNIYNRRAFDELAHHCLRSSRNGGGPNTLLTVDLDFFKAINDRFGHAAGDRVLCLVTESIAAQLRASDIFGRYGGEEFNILLPDTTPEQATMVAERLRQEIESLPLNIKGEALRLTASIGLAIDPNNRQDGRVKTLEILLDESDRALYQAKTMGRNRVVCAEPVEMPAA